MADPHQVTGQVDTPEVRDLSDDIVVLDSGQVENGINEEMLRHSLVDANLDSTHITYAVPVQESTETPGAGLLRSASLERPIRASITTVPHSYSEVQKSGMSISDDTGGENIVSNSQSIFSPDSGIRAGEISTNNTTCTVRIPGETGKGISVFSSLSKSISMPHQITTETISSQPHELVDNDSSQSENSRSDGNNSNQIVHLVPDTKTENEPHSFEKSHLKFHTISQSPAVQLSAPRGISMTPEVLQSVLQQVKAQQITQQPQSSQNLSENEVDPQNNSVSFTLVSPSQQSTAAAPLGSSQNPIRIIQQGNRYTPMQQLTPEQLQQIMQVVQQQHANKAQDNGGTVIFNPHTNTKIMYRVIYPSELHKSQASGQATYQVIRPVTLSQEQQTTTPHQKRPYRKRKEAASLVGTVVNGEEDRERGSGDTPELSKEEKEERKKHRPRTRSGRVSKPPKHMVQDYKHIHVLDWDEDYDDSDGGYSDLKQSDEESKTRQNEHDEQDVSSDLFQALGAGKPKNFKCDTCEKSYIGQAGLERHYRLTPEHRKSEDDNLGGQMQNGVLMDGENSKDTTNTQDGNSSRNSDPGPEASNFNGLDNFSEDSNTQDSVKSTGTSSPIVRRGRGRGGFRGRWAHLKHNAHTRRKNKLREFTKHCSDEDLMEVLFPRLVGSISTWEFLMMKAEKGGSRPKVDVIYKEFEDLLRPLKQVCADYMKPISKEDVSNLESSDKVIKVSDQNLASCLGLSLGTYKVDEMLPDDSNSFSSLHNKLSAASISLSSSTTSHNTNNGFEGNETFNSEKNMFGKRKFAVVSPSKAENIPMKKPCLMNSVSANASSGQPLISVNNSENFKNEPGLLQSSSNILSSFPSTYSMKSTVDPSSNVIKVERSSAPPTSHQSVSYLITASGKGTSATSQALKSQLVPVVLNTASGTSAVAVSSSQILPVVLNPKTSRVVTQQTLMVAAPALSDTSNKTSETTSLPLVLTAQGGHFQGNTIFLASGNQSVGQSVLLKHPSKQNVQDQKQKFISNQQHISPISKSQISLLGSLHTSNTNGPAKVVSSTSSIQRYNSNTKPAEVKVSRKLFHEATASSNSSINSLPVSSTSSFINNSHMNNTTSATSPHNVKIEYPTSSSISSLLPSSTLSLNSAFMDSGHLQMVSGSSLSNTKTELANQELTLNALEPSRETEVPIIVSCSSIATPSSELNRVGTSGNEEDLDTSFDISAGVLSSMGFSGDELSSLNTSSDNPSSIPISLPNLGVNHVSSEMNEIIAPSNVSNGVPLIPPKTAGNGHSMTSINHVSNTNLNFINGSNTEFQTISPPSLKLKDNILQSSSQSSSSFMSSTSDFIHLLANKPSSPLMSSPCKDSALNTVTSVSFNLPSMESSLPSQILKSDGTPPAIMGDLGALTFPDQSVEQLNGVTALHSSDVDSILPEQISQSEAVNPLLELPQQLVSDDLNMAAPSGEEDGQLLLTEGSNIYQTEDGTWFIQCADGNTYQLQGAQGLPMETVQALLSGNLDLNGDVPADEVVQANLLH